MCVCERERERERERGRERERERERDLEVEVQGHGVVPDLDTAVTSSDDVPTTRSEGDGCTHTSMDARHLNRIQSEKQ